MNAENASELGNKWVFIGYSSAVRRCFGWVSAMPKLPTRLDQIPSRRMDCGHDARENANERAVRLVLSS